METIVRSFTKLTGLKDIALFLTKGPIRCEYEVEDHYFGAKSHAVRCDDDNIFLSTTARDPDEQFVRITFCPTDGTLEIKDMVGWGMVTRTAHIIRVDFIEDSYDEDASDDNRKYHYIELVSEDGTKIRLGAQLIVLTPSYIKIL